MISKVGIAALAAIALCACAGRAPAPVAVVQPQDRYMDCAAIMVEVQSNNEKVQQLASDPRGSVKIPRVWSLETPPLDNRGQRR